MIRGIRAAAEASNRRVAGLRFLKDNHSIPAYNHKYPVTRSYAQRLASLTRDHNLVLCGKSRFGHRFTL
jgi:hypothetical protein